MKSTLFLLLVYVCFACNANNTSTVNMTTASLNIQEVVSDQKIVIAQYTDVAVYPAHIEYQFMDENGNGILVKEDTYDYASDPDMEQSEDATELQLPHRMLEDERLMDAEEAFPGANPMLIGQAFKLYYNKAGKVYRIEGEDEINVTRMIYQSAAKYPMHTLYEFSAANGERILVTVSDEEGVSTIQIPNNLLEDDEDLEGLPGENPALVDKAFDLYFDKDNRVVKIELVEVK